MSCLFRASSAILLRAAQSVGYRNLNHCCCTFSSWKPGFVNAGVGKKPNGLGTAWSVRVQLYSSRKTKNGSAKLGSKALMAEEKKEIFVVRKGDLIGVYSSLSDCQAQVGSSICEPPVSIFRGYSMPKDSEEYLESCGLKGAAYTIRAADLKNDLFGTLFPCHIEISVKGDPSTTPLPHKVSLEDRSDAIACTSKPEQKNLNQGVATDIHLPLAGVKSCKLEFDGASKGNPGKAGAGAVLRADDGSVICRLREGLGTATCNVAEYRALILGLKYAFKRGYSHIHVQGDSKLACMQVQGLWRARNKNMVVLCKEAKDLIANFTGFQMNHVLRGSNAEADAEANLAVKLADGEVEEALITSSFDRKTL